MEETSFLSREVRRMSHKVLYGAEVSEVDSATKPLWKLRNETRLSPSSRMSQRRTSPKGNGTAARARQAQTGDVYSLSPPSSPERRSSAERICKDRAQDTSPGRRSSKTMAEALSPKSNRFNAPRMPTPMPQDVKDMVIHVDLLGAEAPEELRSSVEDEPRKLPEKSDVTKSQLKEAPLPFERSGAFPRTNRSSIDFAVRSYDELHSDSTFIRGNNRKLPTPTSARRNVGTGGVEADRPEFMLHAPLSLDALDENEAESSAFTSMASTIESDDGEEASEPPTPCQNDDGLSPELLRTSDVLPDHVIDPSHTENDTVPRDDASDTLTSKVVANPEDDHKHEDKILDEAKQPAEEVVTVDLGTDYGMEKPVGVRPIGRSPERYAPGGAGTYGDRTGTRSLPSVGNTSSFQGSRAPPSRGRDPRSVPSDHANKSGRGARDEENQDEQRQQQQQQQQREMQELRSARRQAIETEAAGNRAYLTRKSLPNDSGTRIGRSPVRSASSDKSSGGSHSIQWNTLREAQLRKAAPPSVPQLATPVAGVASRNKHDNHSKPGHRRASEHSLA